jgi:hypothetical protein
MGLQDHVDVCFTQQLCEVTSLVDVKTIVSCEQCLSIIDTSTQILSSHSFVDHANQLGSCRTIGAADSKGINLSAH